ncbi:unnamed protein product [Nezara viridula]|uniref:Ubiquitin-like protein NEDD8 n=1 Tax=Nezara viridula TaxID=85310 RepID=A0A9P0MLY6_NEZVI|nr:unnamed protein product [Nezara viridula]
MYREPKRSSNTPNLRDHLLRRNHGLYKPNSNSKESSEASPSSQIAGPSVSRNRSPTVECEDEGEAEVIDDSPLANNGMYSSQDKKKNQTKTLTGKEIEIDIEPTDKVERIKERVEEKEGIPPQQQRLIFSGKQMNDEKTAQDYKVQGGSVLHLVLALRGGKFY